MAITEQDITQIERYLDNSMSTEEALLFEQRVASSPELQTELQLHKEAIAALQEKTRLKHELRSIFEDVKKERKSTKPTKVIPLFKYWSAAAVLLVLVSVFTYYFSTKPADAQDLFNSYYQPLPTNGVSRDDTVSTTWDDLTLTMHLYQQGKYNEAIKGFKVLTGGEGVNDKWWVYLANCYISTEAPDLAREALQTALKSKSNFNRQYAEWYIALLDIKEEKLDSARVRLVSIHEAGGIYQKEAGTLLEALE